MSDDARTTTHWPGFWRNETSGVLAPAIHAYLTNKVMTDGEIAAMRAYLRQWIMAPCWQDPTDAEHAPILTRLRADLNDLITRAAIARWLELADDIAIDPL